MWTAFLYVNGRVFQTIQVMDLKPEIYVAIQEPIRLEAPPLNGAIEPIDMKKMTFRCRSRDPKDKTAEYELEGID